MSHTKDHWAIGIIGEESVEVINNEGCVVACVEHYPLMETARFIAAAPELLAALQSLVELLADDESHMLPEEHVMIDNAREAIAKATGEQP